MNVLKAHLRSVGETQDNFAKRIKRRPATVSGWCNGTVPSLLDAFMIQTQTDGGVPLQAWLPEDEEATP